MIFKVLIGLMSFYSVLAFAANTTVSIDIALKSPLVKQDKVFYGTPEIGFFEAKTVSQSDGKLNIILNPPTYKRDILFYAKTTKGNQLLFKKKFSRPISHPEDIAVELKGSFTSPFFLINLLSYETKRPSFYAAVINQFGEVVWYDKSHMRPKRDLESSTNLSMLEWKNGVIIRGAGSNSIWNFVDWKGIQKPVFEKLEYQGQPIYAHHSMGTNLKEIFFWVSMKEQLSPLKDNIPVFSGLMGKIRALKQKGRIILGSRLMALNPETKQIREVTNSFKLMNPAQAGSRSLDETMDRFQYAKTIKDYTLYKSRNEKETYVPFHYDTDWTHENSIDVDYENNFIITIRNLNTIMKLSPSGKPLWSIGEESFATHKLADPSAEMGLPHSARFTQEGNIVIFDNSAPFRGMSKGNSNSRILYFQLNKEGTAKVVNEIVLPGDKSLTKGSVHRLPDNHFLVWHPGPNTSPAQLFELDKNGDFMGHLILKSLGYKKHDEVIPLSSIGDPTYNFIELQKYKILNIEKGYEDVY